MKPTRILAAMILSIGVSALALAQGGSVQRETKLAVNEPTQVGSALLDPGSYTLRVHDFTNEKITVVIMRDSDQKTVGTVVAMRDRRNLDSHEASDNQTQFTYTTFNGHPAVATWFYPGDEWGERFAYGKETVAVNTTGGSVTMTQTQQTPSVSTMAESTPPPVVEEKRETVETAPAPAPAPEPAPAPVEKTLPKTASPVPLVGLLGALSLAGAAALRIGRRKAA